MPVRHQLLTLDRHPKGSPASRTPTRCASPHWARAPLQSRPHRRGRAHSLTAVAPTGGLFSYIRAHTVSRSRSHTRLSHPPPSMYLLIALSPTLSSPALSHAGRHSQFTAHISRLALRKAHIHGSHSPPRTFGATTLITVTRTPCRCPLSFALVLHANAARRDAGVPHPTVAHEHISPSAAITADTVAFLRCG